LATVAAGLAGSVTGATMEVQSQQVVLNLTVGF